MCLSVFYSRLLWLQFRRVLSPVDGQRFVWNHCIVWFHCSDGSVVSIYKIKPFSCCRLYGEFSQWMRSFDAFQQMFDIFFFLPVIWVSVERAICRFDRIHNWQHFDENKDGCLWDFSFWLWIRKYLTCNIWSMIIGIHGCLHAICADLVVFFSGKRHSKASYAIRYVGQQENWWLCPKWFRILLHCTLRWDIEYMKKKNKQIEWTRMIVIELMRWLWTKINSN